MRVAAATAAVFALVTSAAHGASPRTHCTASETVVYSCAFARKVASVCAGPDQISYRFGPPGAPQLSITSNGRDGSVHVGGVVGGGGGSATNLRFTNGAHQYLVHSAIYGSLTDIPGQTSSGIVVLKGANRDAATVAVLACRQKPTDQDQLRSAVPSFVPEEPDDRWDAWY